METDDEIGGPKTFDSTTHRFDIAPDERPSEAVVTAVAAATGRPLVPSDEDPTVDSEPALPPLQDRVDADALDAWIESLSQSNGTCEVTFAYCGCTVTVGPETVTVSR